MRSGSHGGSHGFDISKVQTPEDAVKSWLLTMIPHHQEAIRTSMRVVSDSEIENPDLRILASRIVDAQTFETVQMATWYKEWFGVEYDPSMNTYIPMMAEVEVMTGEDLKKEYLKGMIKHHKAAVAMSEDLLEYFEEYKKKTSTTDGELVVTNSNPAIDQMTFFAQKIITDQSKEIELLSSLR